MPRLIPEPTVVAAAGSKPTQIEEYAGRVKSAHTHLSAARMVSPGRVGGTGPTAAVRGSDGRVARDGARGVREPRARRTSETGALVDSARSAVIHSSLAPLRGGSNGTGDASEPAADPRKPTSDRQEPSQDLAESAVHIEKPKEDSFESRQDSQEVVRYGRSATTFETPIATAKVGHVPRIRAVCGVHIAIIASSHHISVDGELAAILPAKLLDREV